MTDEIRKFPGRLAFFSRSLSALYIPKRGSIRMKGYVRQ